MTNKKQQELKTAITDDGPRLQQQDTEGLPYLSKRAAKATLDLNTAIAELLERQAVEKQVMEEYEEAVNNLTITHEIRARIADVALDTHKAELTARECFATFMEARTVDWDAAQDKFREQKNYEKQTLEKELQKLGYSVADSQRLALESSRVKIPANKMADCRHRRDDMNTRRGNADAIKQLRIKAHAWKRYRIAFCSAC